MSEDLPDWVRWLPREAVEAIDRYWKPVWDTLKLLPAHREHGITHVMNAVDPVFDMPIFDGAFEAGADYLDMAMSLSRRHPEAPYEKVGVKLGDEQFAQAGHWEQQGRLALLGMGVEPGLSDVFARYAADHLFSDIDELGTRDGSNLVVTDDEGLDALDVAVRV